VIVRWSRLAATQLFDAGDYIGQQRPGWDERLYIATRRVTERIGQQPRVFPQIFDIHDGEVRRALVRVFEYWVIYEVIEPRNQCIVLAFWSTRRHPQGWRHGP